MIIETEDCDWNEGGLNYLKQRVDTRLYKRYIFDTISERTKFIRALDNQDYIWSIYEKDVDGIEKFVYELIESNLMDVPNGTVEDFPFIELLYFNDDTLENDIFSIKNDYTVDNSIRDILLDFTKLDIRIVSSGSGLFEDYIEYFPNRQPSNPNIYFRNVKDLSIVGKLVRGSRWKIEVRYHRDYEDFIITCEGPTEKENLEAWNLLRERLKNYKESLI